MPGIVRYREKGSVGMSDKEKNENKSGEEETKDLFNKSLEDGTVDRKKEKDTEEKKDN